MSDLKKITVYPGQFVITASPALITTVLGSCVSVCLWDKKEKIGGMNHYLLPGENADAGNANRGVTSISMLIHAMLRRNCKLENLEAKIFGGCNSLYINNDLFKVGVRNVEVARQVLNQFEIPVVARHIGGTSGRKIIFNTSTGKVKMILLNKAAETPHETPNKGSHY